MAPKLSNDHGCDDMEELLVSKNIIKVGEDVSILIACSVMEHDCKHAHVPSRIEPKLVRCEGDAT